MVKQLMYKILEAKELTTNIYSMIGREYHLRFVIMIEKRER